VISTLADEICDDHERILCRLEQLAEREAIDAKSAQPILVAIGAHHLAEEDTLYDALKSYALASIGEAQVYHMVLDDLTHAIDGSHQSEDPLRYQLRLLRHLLEHHFMMEETQLLEILIDRFSLKQQLALGRQYRERYRQNIRALRRKEISDQFAIVEMNS